MYCIKCGTQLPDEAVFCMKCGASQAQGAEAPQSSYGGASAPASGSSQQILAPSGVTSLKCPNCGAPISPKFGEMVITCEYCGSGVTLGDGGWKSILKQTMLPLKVVDQAAATQRIHQTMDKGFLHRHLQESSTLEEMTLTIVPYWVMPASARTSIVASDMTMEVGSIATTAAIIGVMGAMAGGDRRGGG